MVPKAASSRAASRIGAGRAFSRRVRVAECFLASLELGGILLIADAYGQAWRDEKALCVKMGEEK